MRDMTAAQAIQAAVCPECGAAAGAWCVNGFGKPDVHIARLNAAGAASMARLPAEARVYVAGPVRWAIGAGEIPLGLLKEAAEIEADAAIVEGGAPGSTALVVYYADGSVGEPIMGGPEASLDLNFGEGRQVSRIKVIRRVSPDAERKFADQDAERRAAQSVENPAEA